jgi:hypothetical protein
MMGERSAEMIKHILKRLKMTRLNESICLSGWEVSVLLEWIDEIMKGRKDNESVDTRRNNESG